MPQSPPLHNARLVEYNRKEGQKEYNRTKRKNQGFYNSRQWRNVRDHYWLNNPVCEVCKKNGRATVADVIDHIIPISEGGDLFGENNLQSLCHLHHNQKTVEEQGRGAG